MTIVYHSHQISVLFIKTEITVFDPKKLKIQIKAQLDLPWLEKCNIYIFYSYLFLITFKLL